MTITSITSVTYKQLPPHRDPSLTPPSQALCSDMKPALAVHDMRDQIDDRSGREIRPWRLCLGRAKERQIRFSHIFLGALVSSRLDIR